MPISDKVGLTFNEAFESALAEEEETASTSPSTVIEGPEDQNVGEQEQPAVETEEEEGVFTSLASEKAKGEQPEGDSHKVTVNGETFEVSRQELIDGYQRHADYTRSKQELAKQREQNENAVTLWEALEEDYVGTVNKLMSRANIRGKVAPAQQEPSANIDELVEQKLQEKLASDPRLQHLEQEASLRQINEIFGEVEQEYDVQLANSDKQLILEKAEEWGTTDLSYVTWRLLQMREKMMAEQENADLVSTVKGRRSGSEDDATPNVEYYATVKDAWESALAEENSLE